MIPVTIPVAGMLVSLEVPAEVASLLVQVLISGALAYQRVGKAIWAPERWARRVSERCAAALAAGGDRWRAELQGHETHLRRWHAQAEAAWTHPFTTAELVTLMHEGVSASTGRVLVLPDRLPIARGALAALIGHGPDPADACALCRSAGGKGIDRLLYAHAISEQAVRELFLGLVAARVIPLPTPEQIRPSDPRENDPDVF